MDSNKLAELEERRKFIYEKLCKLKEQEVELLTEFSWLCSQIEMINLKENFVYELGNEKKISSIVQKNDYNNGNKLSKDKETTVFEGRETRERNIKNEELVSKKSKCSQCVLPDSYYDQFSEMYNKSIYSLNWLSIEKTSSILLNRKNFDEWENFVKDNTNILLQESDDVVQFYGMPVDYNGNSYYLVSIEADLQLSEYEIITKAIDKFFDIDLNLAIAGHSYTLIKPAVFRKIQDGYLELVEKGDLDFS